MSRFMSEEGFIRKEVMSDRGMVSFKSLKQSPGIIRKASRIKRPAHQSLSVRTLCVCLCVSFLWRSQPSTQLFLSAVHRSYNECKGNLVSWRRVWNLDDICGACSFLLDHHAKITRSWIRATVSVARELSSHLVTKQQHGMKPFAALPASCGEQRNMQPHTQMNALCVNLYTPAVTDL